MERGKRLKELRKKINLTQEELGNKLNVSRSNIGNIETGNIKLSDRNVKEICRIFNVNEDWLANGNGEMFNTKNEDKELLDFVIKALNNENEFVKKTFITLSKLDESEWKVIQKIIDSLKNK